MTTLVPLTAASARRRKYRPCTCTDVRLQREHGASIARTRACIVIASADRSTNSTTTRRLSRTLAALPRRIQHSITQGIDTGRGAG
jgi:hypothetical protein